VADGKYPSVDAVRHALGDSGSKSTIHKYLRELRDEDPDVGLQRDDTDETLRTVVGQLAERLHANADARIKARLAALQAGHEDTLNRKEAELAALRATVAALSARVTQLETRRAGDGPGDDLDEERYGLARSWRTPRPDQAHAGFGRFDSGLLSSRSGPGASSPFEMIRTVARS